MRFELFALVASLAAGGADKTVVEPGLVAVLPIARPASLEVDSTMLNELSELFCAELLEKGARVTCAASVRETLANQNQSLDELVEGRKYLTIAEAVGARYVLTGSVLEWEEHQWFQHEGRIGLSAQLLDARTGELLWSDSQGKSITFVESKSMVDHLKKTIAKLMRDVVFASKSRRR